MGGVKVTSNFLAKHHNISVRGICSIAFAGCSTVQWNKHPTLRQSIRYKEPLKNRLLLGSQGNKPYWQFPQTCTSITDGFWKCSRKYHTHKEGPEIEIQPDTFNSTEKTEKFIKKLRRKQRTLLLTQLQILNQEQSKVIQDDPSLLQPPSRQQLNLVILNNAVPFVGFGFLDNAIMIIAGEYIDWRIGAVLGISTLAAAGLGNLISDLAGVVLAGYVEAFAARLGLRSPNLSLEQYDMRSSKIASAVGRCVGIVIGCLLGLFPLLFLNTEPRAPSEDDSQDSPGPT